MRGTILTMETWVDLVVPMQVIMVRPGVTPPMEVLTLA